MVPVPEHTKVKGVPIPKMMSAAKIEAINQRTRDGGAEIVKYLKTGSAFYAPSSSVVRMVRAIIQDRHEVIPACVYLEGQYGIRDVYCGVPVRFGQQGVAEIVEIDLTADQKKALQISAEHVRENCAKLNLESRIS